MFGYRLKAKCYITLKTPTSATSVDYGNIVNITPVFNGMIVISLNLISTVKRNLKAIRRTFVITWTDYYF